jgi:hypothetical protein
MLAAYAAGCAFSITDPARELVAVVLIFVFALLMAGLAVVLDGMYIVGSPSVRERLAETALDDAEAATRRLTVPVPNKWWHLVVAWLAPWAIATITTAIVFAATGDVDWWRGLAVGAVVYLAITTSTILSGFATTLCSPRAAKAVNGTTLVVGLLFVATPLVLVALAQTTSVARNLLLLVTAIAVVLAAMGMFPAEKRARLKWRTARWVGACLARQILDLRVEVARIDLAEVRRRKIEIESWTAERAA